MIQNEQKCESGFIQISNSQAIPVALQIVGKTPISKKVTISSQIKSLTRKTNKIK